MYQARTLLSRSFASLSNYPLRVCIVGSGPAGFYTAEKTLKAHQEAQVDIIDRLPTPFGLVRSGVAPDHPEKQRSFTSILLAFILNYSGLYQIVFAIVINQFSRVAQHERCSFFGNVSLGSSISLSELRQLYHVVVLAYGAESDRVFHIPGEDLFGIHSAREFVWWYNGHPDCRNLNPDLKSTDTAVILGQGNVALDVARILLRPTEELATTDIASHALNALEESYIRKVYLVGRRGPVQAACTTKELREVLGIKNLFVNIKEADLVKTPADEEEMKNSRIQRRVYELLSKAAASASSQSSSGQRELHFVFFRKPDCFLESEKKVIHVSGVHFEKTALKGVGPGKQVAVGTGEFEDIDCRMVLKSIGYKSVPVNGLPFDHRKGKKQKRIIVDQLGLLLQTSTVPEETVASISEDLEKGMLSSISSLPKPGREGLLQLLDRRDVIPIPYSSWEKIDSVERRLGSLRNKPREKLTSWEDLLKAATT
ncbi:hypothetical protein Patl1_13286 [Pistacia atlantica]|uniref:Uncharacterized protein n=1 Tax=Pistacia atlantica TaxID=434234 RepID=A0ACC1AWY6_9ROSI|nr:hypothetical protein Patl1_13286 [Pistacia atlantica]